jgi:hypothetical protein
MAQIREIQRQVTARPVAGLQGRQDSARIDPSANALVQGLASFADAAAGVVRQKESENQDAQAAVADIGLDGYQRAMKGALDARPELYAQPEELAKLDQEMRGTYFKDITDERIKGRVTARVDGWLQSSAATYKYAKQEQDRYNLAGRTLQLGVEKLEAAVKAGQGTPEEAQAQLKQLIGTLRTSPSFMLSQERVEKLIEQAQDVYAKDGSRRLLLAQTFMNDEGISPELRQSLQLDEVHAMKQTDAEKEQAKFAIYQKWEGLINKGRFSWAEGQKAVDAGIVSASDVRSSMRRQQEQMEKAIKEAQKAREIQNGNPLTMDSKTFAKWEKQARLQLPKEQYYALMHQVGGASPAVKAMAERAFSTASAPVETEDQIPQAFSAFVDGEGAYLYGAGLLSQHIAPEQLEDVAAYMFMTQSLGKSKVESYNLMVNGSFSKYSDIDRLRLAQLKKELRSGLDLAKDAPNNLVDATASVAMKLTKAGMEVDAAKDAAVKMTKGAFAITDYGPVPRARFGTYTTEEGLNKRLAFSAEETAKELRAQGYEDARAKDLQVMLLDDGRFAFTRKGGHTIVGSKAYRLMTDNAPELPDGTQTVEGARQDKLINDQFAKPVTRPTGPLIGGGL